MVDKRQYNRCDSSQDRAYIDLSGKKEEVEILDISIGGMRVISNYPIVRDVEVTGEFKILPSVGSFFVKGKVVWVTEKDDNFESGIQFDKVSTIPISTVS